MAAPASERHVYVDGQYYPRSQAKVSVFDHGLLYGDGVFEGIRVYDGYIFELRSHLKRLQDSAKAIALELPMGLEAMERLCYECVQKNALKDGYIRLVVTRGTGDLGIDPRNCKAPTLIVIADQITLYPKEFYEKGIEAITSSVRRMNPEALSPNIKSLNYLNNVLAKIEANLRGAGEALMLNREGFVAEAAADNVFVVKDGHVITPPGSLGALRGVTRRRVMEIARELGYPLEKKAFTIADVYAADEVFLTGTAAELIPVIKVDGRSIGNGKPGPMTATILKRFRQVIRNEVEAWKASPATVKTTVRR